MRFFKPYPPWQYIAIALLTFCLVLVWAGGSLWLLQYRGIAEKEASDVKSFTIADVLQKTAFQQSPSPAIRLIGGSSSLYSVSASDLSRRLGMPVTNLGSNAGLGLDYILYRAKRYLRPNDVAVLLIEYPLFSVYLDKPSWTAASWVIPYDYKYIFTQRPERLVDLFSRLTAEEYGTRFLTAYAGKRFHAAEHFKSWGIRGDFVNNLETRITSETQQSLRKTNEAPMAMQLDTRSLEKLRDFISWCHKRNITVIGSFPPFLEHPAYKSTEYQMQMQVLAGVWEKLGIPAAGSPMDVMFPENLFFDTHFHMHSGGRRIMTAYLAHELQKKLPPELLKNQDTLPYVFDMTRPYPYPDGFIYIAGIGNPEGWGVWSDGPGIKLEFAGTLTGSVFCTLNIVRVFQDTPRQLRIRAGSDEKEIRITTPGIYSVQINSKQPFTEMYVDVDKPISPKELGLSKDSRKLGIGLKSIELSRSR